MKLSAAGPSAPLQQRMTRQQDEGQRDVRTANIIAARAVADAVRTSLGPKGMDKMIRSPGGDVIITNDGATILKEMKLMHPAARMLVELSKAQDVEAGDGTTSVVVVAGALLGATQRLMEKGLHPSVISEAFLRAAARCNTILQGMSVPVDLANREVLIQAAETSLSSKIISQYSSLFAPLAVDAVLKVIDPKTATNVNLANIRVVTKLGATVDETQLVDGMIFPRGVSGGPGGPRRVEGAKIAFIQFQLAAPKPYVDSNVVVSDYNEMDRIFKEERTYILNMCNKIKKTGCNVLLVQKSILRDAVTDISLQLLAKLKILVITDVDREDMKHVCSTLGCKPMPSIETVSADKLGSAALVEEIGTAEGKCVKITGTPNNSNTVTVLVRASNTLMLGEAERSFHDALCVIRSLVKRRFMIPGGGAAEIECSVQLGQLALEEDGPAAYCFRAFADALEVIPYTLAENAGLHPMKIVTELRRLHASGEKSTGINIRKGTVTNMLTENVLQPLLVSQSLIGLATETVAMLLKIDDICAAR